MSNAAEQLENNESSASNPSEVSQPVESATVPTEENADSGLNQALEFADIGVDLEAKQDGSVNEQPLHRANSAETEASAAMAEMAGQMESLKAQLEDRTGQYMRMAADFENFRKRTQKEKEDQEQQLKCSTIVEMLPVVDNFERARSHIKPQTESEMNIHKSYQGVYKQLVDCLKRLGVAPMRSEGKEFDPSLHEAVMREATDEYAEGTVIEELVRGYLLGDRVLRHAMVKVAAPPEPMIPSEEDLQTDGE
jgi:molecular chaperone GrpE